MQDTQATGTSSEFLAFTLGDEGYGVETAEQQDFLVAQECDEAQGYYLGRPMEAGSFAALLEEMVSVAAVWGSHYEQDLGQAKTG